MRRRAPAGARPDAENRPRPSVRSTARVRQPAKPRDWSRTRRPARGTRPPRTRPETTVSAAATADPDADRGAHHEPQRHAPRRRSTSRTWRDGPIRVKVVSRPSRRVRTPVIGRQRPPATRSSIRTGVCASGRPARSVRRPRMRTRVGQVTVARRRRRRPRSSQAVSRPRGPRCAAGGGAAATGRGTTPLGAEATRTLPPPSPATRRRGGVGRRPRPQRVGARHGAADLGAARVASQRSQRYS